MATATPAQSSILDQKLKDNPPAKWGVAAFAVVLVGGLIYIVWRMSIDLSPVHQSSIFPYVLLGVALLIALGFEFVNFHTIETLPGGYETFESNRAASFINGRHNIGIRICART